MQSKEPPAEPQSVNLKTLTFADWARSAELLINILAVSRTKISNQVVFEWCQKANDSLEKMAAKSVTDTQLRRMVNLSNAHLEHCVRGGEQAKDLFLAGSIRVRTGIRKIPEANRFREDWFKLMDVGVSFYIQRIKLLILNVQDNDNESEIKRWFDSYETKGLLQPNTLIYKLMEFISKMAWDVARKDEFFELADELQRTASHEPDFKLISELVNFIKTLNRGLSYYKKRSEFMQAIDTPEIKARLDELEVCSTRIPEQFSSLPTPRP